MLQPLIWGALMPLRSPVHRSAAAPRGITLEHPPPKSLVTGVPSAQCIRTDH